MGLWLLRLLDLLRFLNANIAEVWANRWHCHGVVADAGSEPAWYAQRDGMAMWCDVVLSVGNHRQASIKNSNQSFRCHKAARCLMFWNVLNDFDEPRTGLNHFKHYSLMIWKRSTVHHWSVQHPGQPPLQIFHTVLPSTELLWAKPTWIARCGSILGYHMVSLR